MQTPAWVYHQLGGACPVALDGHASSPKRGGWAAAATSVARGQRATLHSRASGSPPSAIALPVGVPFSGHQIVGDQLKRIVDAVGIANNILR